MVTCFDKRGQTQDWNDENLIDAFCRSSDKPRMEYLRAPTWKIIYIRALQGHSPRCRNQSTIVLFEQIPLNWKSHNFPHGQLFLLQINPRDWSINRRIKFERRTRQACFFSHLIPQNSSSSRQRTIDWPGPVHGRTTDQQSIHHVLPGVYNLALQNIQKGSTLSKLCRIIKIKKARSYLGSAKKEKYGTIVEDENYQLRMHEQGYTQSDMEEFDRIANAKLIDVASSGEQAYHVKGMYPAPHIHEHFTRHKWLRQTAYIFTHNLNMLEHIANNGMNTTMHTDANIAQF